MLKDNSYFYSSLYDIIWRATLYEGVHSMYYKFKILKTGLRFLGISPVEKDKKDILYVNEKDLYKIAVDSITNIKDIKDLKGMI